MGEALRRRIAQTRFEGPHHEALLNLLVAASHLQAGYDLVFSGHDLTRGQYNVLRILRGVHPEGCPRCEIVQRMIDRAPDVTRLIDRLESQGLAERLASESDRRLSITRITRKGLRLLKRIQPEVDRVEQGIGSRLSTDEARELSRICERLYEAESP